MAFIWQERTHDNNDIEAFTDAGCWIALPACRLLKFFLTLLLWSQPDLLELLIRAWNPRDGKFIIRGRDIEFDSTDIYFLTGLSCRGERPILEGKQPGGDSLDILMAQVCPGAPKTRSGKVEIPTVDEVILRAMIFMVTWVAGSLAQHEASKIAPAGSRVSQSRHVWLGRDSDGKHKEATHQLQSRRDKLVWLWIHLSPAHARVGASTIVARHGFGLT